MREVLGEIERLRTEPVPAKELMDKKRSLVAGFALSLESPSAVLSNYVIARRYGLPADYWDRYPERVMRSPPSNCRLRRRDEAGKPRTRRTAKDCLECHRTDMRPSRTHPPDHALATAAAYRPAMHQACIGCRRLRAQEAGRPGLGDCSNCHRPAAGRPAVFASLDDGHRAFEAGR